MSIGKIKFTGLVTAKLLDINGNILETQQANLVVDAGLNHIMSRIEDNSASVMSHMAVGSGATAVAGADTALGTELARVIFDSITRTDNVITYVTTFGAGTGTGSINEAGIFNAASAGTMLARTLFGATINKGASDTLEFTWEITGSAT
jgi:hypothetical protein